MNLNEPLPAGLSLTEIRAKPGTTSLSYHPSIIADVMGDSKPELIISAILSPVSGVGETYIFSGFQDCPLPSIIDLNSIGSCIKLVTILQKPSISSGTGFWGYSSQAVDLIGNSKSDIVLGDFSYDYMNPIGAGEVYILDLSSITQTTTISLEEPSVRCVTIKGDQSVSADIPYQFGVNFVAGDVGHDGQNELIINNPARLNSPSNSDWIGAKYVIFGLKNFNGLTLDLTSPPSEIAIVRLIANSCPPVASLFDLISLGDYVDNQKLDLLTTDLKNLFRHYTISEISRPATTQNIFLGDPPPRY